MSIEEDLKKGEEAQNILNKAKELEDRIHAIFSNIQKISRDEANSLIENYGELTKHAEGILTSLPEGKIEAVKDEKKRRRSIKDYPDETRFKIYQYLISQYFENKNKIIETPEIATEFNIAEKSATTYIIHNKGLENVGNNRWKFKKDFLKDKTLPHMINMLLKEKESIKARDISEQHAISIGIILKNKCSDYGLGVKTISGGLNVYFKE